MSLVTNSTVSRGASGKTVPGLHLPSAVLETERVPLSCAQKRLWFLDQLEPNSPLYNMPAVARISGRLDLLALERAVKTIVARHESLRTRIACEDEMPSQMIADSIAV